jgi:acid phosphatase type 7
VLPRQLVAVLVLAAAGTARAGFAVAPYLQNRTDTTIVVRWTTTTADSGKVDYGLTAGYGQTVSHSSATSDHELTLTGLLQDTTYHYRAISGADTSADAEFPGSVTAQRTFRFLAYGDNHSNDSAAHQGVVNRMMLVERASFAASAGDLTSNGLTTQYSLFFDVESRLLSRLPLLPAVGNHDADSLPNWFRFIALPGNERWHSFRCGNSAFHCLNVNESFAPTSEQYNWFLDQLLADSADDVHHILVLLHLPPYTTSTVYSGNADVRDYLCPLFERFRVDVVFSGHVHAYEHSLVNGVHYIITGGGGGTLATGWNAAQPWTVYREATHEFVQVDVAGDTVRTVGIRPEGSEFDTLVLVAGHVGCDEPSCGQQPGRSGLSAEFGSSRLRFTLAEPAMVTARLYDAAGRVVARPVNAHLGTGEHVIEWNRCALGPGVYYGVVRAGASSFAARLTVLRQASR